MTNNSTKSVALQSEAETAIHVFDDWFDPIEAGLRDRVREFIQAMIEGELEAALSRSRAERAFASAGATGSFAANEGGFANGIGETGGVAELDAGSDAQAVPEVAHRWGLW